MRWPLHSQQPRVFLTFDQNLVASGTTRDSLWHLRLQNLAGFRVDAGLAAKKFLPHDSQVVGIVGMNGTEATMALNPKRSNVAANAACDAMAALCNSGYLRVYDGSQPATADTALSGQNLLAELRFSATAFAASVAGVATANAITAAVAAATGTAAWFRVLKSDGTTVVWDGSVATATADLVLNSTAIQVGAQVSVSSLTLTEGK